MNLVFKNPPSSSPRIGSIFLRWIKLAETKGYLYNTYNTYITYNMYVCMYVAQHYTYTVTQHNTQQARTYIYIYVYKCPT